jgi:hypothetical protein
LGEPPVQVFWLVLAEALLRGRRLHRI